MPLGMNLTSLANVLKCAKDDDICALKAADEAGPFNLVYETKSELLFLVGLSFFHVVFVTRQVSSFQRFYESHAQKKIRVDSDRIAEYDTLGMPETEYEPRVTSEFRLSVSRSVRKALGSPVRQRLLIVACSTS